MTTAPGRKHWLLRPRLFSRGGHSEGYFAARNVYGAVLVLALLLTLEAHPPGPWRAVALIAGTVLAVMLAELYADVLGEEVDKRRPLRRDERVEILRDVAVIAAAAEGPVLIFVLAGLGVIEEERAFRVAVYLTIGLLCCYGYLARRLSGRSQLAALRSALVLGGLGIVLAFFKRLVGH